MPILHIRVKGNNEVINLDSGIHAQQFTLKRCIVIKDPTVSATSYDYRGGISASFDWLQGGLEIKSNINSDELSIPIDVTKEVNDVRFDLNFASEDVNRSFQTNIFNYTKTGDRPTFDEAGTNGELKYIDFYFQYFSSYDINRY